MEALLSQHDNERVPVMIGCSANGNEAKVQQAFLSAGASMCWSKPLPELDTIRAELRDMLLDAYYGLPGQIRVCVVDDSVVSRKFMALMLSQVGTVSWRFVEFASANAALTSMGFEGPKTEGPGADEWTIGGQRLEAAAPYDCGHDLIVLDQDMPGIPGTAAMALLRKAGCRAVIVGFSGSSTEEEHFAAGADLSWTKPLPEREVAAVSLRRAFGDRGQFA